MVTLLLLQARPEDDDVTSQGLTFSTVTGVETLGLMASATFGIVLHEVSGLEVTLKVSDARESTGFAETAWVLVLGRLGYVTRPPTLWTDGYRLCRYSLAGSVVIGFTSCSTPPISFTDYV